MNPTKRRTRLLFLARALREEAERRDAKPLGRDGAQDHRRVRPDRVVDEASRGHLAFERPKEGWISALDGDAAVVTVGSAATAS